MLTTDKVSLLIALTSLIVSIFSFVYARRAYRLDFVKYQDEKSSKDVLLNFSKTGRDQYQDYVILVTELEIRNKSLSVKFARYLNAVLYFGYDWRRPHTSDPKLRIASGIDEPITSSSTSNTIADFIDSHESIRIVVVDAETYERVIFSQDIQKKLEPEPTSYVWKVYTIIPQEVIEYLSNQNIELDFFTIELKIYPEEWKSHSTHRFPFRSANLSPTVLSHIFGDK